MPTYLIPVTCNLGKVFSSVGEMVDSVNETMHGFGFPEEMSVRSQILTNRLTVERELTHEEKLKIYALMQETYREKLPEQELEVAHPNEWSLE